VKITAVSAYPSAIQAANVSKETTLSELLSVGEIDTDMFKLENINLITSGPLAIVDYATNMMGFPSMFTVFDLYENETNNFKNKEVINNSEYLSNKDVMVI
jgi:hypothetical protein